MTLIGMPFDVTSLRVTIYFFGVISVVEEAFENAF